MGKEQAVYSAVGSHLDVDIRLSIYGACWSACHVLNHKTYTKKTDAGGKVTRTCRVRRTTRPDGWAAEAVHGHSLWIEPCECREGCKHSTEAAVSGRSLNRTGHRPAARRPPRQTSIQHEVVSSTVIRPCSRELLPGTLLLLLPPIRGVGVRPGSPWEGHTQPAALWGDGIQGARPSDPKRPRPSYRGHVAYRHYSCRQVFSPVGFVLVVAVFPSVYSLLPSVKPTAYTRILCLVPVPRASLIPSRPVSTALSSPQVSVSQPGLPDLDNPP